MDISSQHALQQAEHLRDRVVDFQEGRTEGSNLLLLHPLVEDVRALATSTATEMPAIDVDKDPTSATWRTVRTFLDTLVTSLKRD